VDFPRDLVLPDGLVTISPYHQCSVGATIGSMGGPYSSTWASASRAIFVPFRIPRSILVLNMWTYNGAAVGNNLDIGIYSKDGTRLVSSGSTAQAGINVIQTLDITDTLIGPGLFYMALSFDGTVSTVFRSLPGNIVFPRILGMVSMNNAFPLPASAVFATLASSTIPVFGLTVRSIV